MQYVWCPSVRRRHWQERTSTRVTWAISKDTKLTQSSSLQISTGPSPFLCSNVIMHSSLARHLTKKFLDALIQVLVWVGGTVAFWKEGVWVMNNRCRNIRLDEWSPQSMKLKRFNYWRCRLFSNGILLSLFRSTLCTTTFSFAIISPRANDKAFSVSDRASLRVSLRYLWLVFQFSN